MHHSVVRNVLLLSICWLVFGHVCIIDASVVILKDLRWSRMVRQLR